MVGVLVPLVPPSTWVFDGLAAGVSLATTVVNTMPLFAWSLGAMVVRVEANTLAAGIHSFSAQIYATAPTLDAPDQAFVGPLFTQLAVSPSDATGKALFRVLLPPLPPFGDLVFVQSNVGGAPAVGSLTVAVDALVRGRFADRIVAAGPIAARPAPAAAPPGGPR